MSNLTYRDLLEMDASLPEEIIEEAANPFEEEQQMMANARTPEEYDFYRKRLDSHVNQLLSYYEDQLDDLEGQNRFGILEDGDTIDLTDPIYEKMGEIKSAAYPWYEEMIRHPELFFDGYEEANEYTEGVGAVIGGTVAVLGGTVLLFLSIAIAACEVALPVLGCWALLKVFGNKKKSCMKAITKAYKKMHPEIVPYQKLDVVHISAAKVRSLKLKWKYLNKWESDVENLNYYGYFNHGKLMYVSAFVKIQSGTQTIDAGDVNIEEPIYKYGHDHAYLDPDFEMNREYYDNMACFDYGISDVSMQEFLKMLKYQAKHGYNEECEVIRDEIESGVITEETITHILQAAQYGYITEEAAQHKIDLIHRLEHADFHEEIYL